MSDLSSYKPPNIAPIHGSVGNITYDAVLERLVEAWGFLRRLPDREAAVHRVKAYWPDIRRHTWFGDYADHDAWAKDEAPRMPGLRAAEVTRMEEALFGWIGWVAPRDRRLIGIVLAQLDRGEARPDWIAAAGAHGGEVSPDACRMRFDRAIARIAAKLAKGLKPAFEPA